MKVCLPVSTESLPLLTASLFFPVHAFLHTLHSSPTSVQTTVALLTAPGTHNKYYPIPPSTASPKALRSRAAINYYEDAAGHEASSPTTEPTPKKAPAGRKKASGGLEGPQKTGNYVGMRLQKVEKKRLASRRTAAALTEKGSTKACAIVIDDSDTTVDYSDDDALYDTSGAPSTDSSSELDMANGEGSTATASTKGKSVVKSSVNVDPEGFVTKSKQRAPNANNGGGAQDQVPMMRDSLRWKRRLYDAYHGEGAYDLCTGGRLYESYHGTGSYTKSQAAATDRG